MRLRMQRLGVGVVSAATVLSMGTVAKAQVCEYAETISRLDLYGARDWVDINQKLLADDRLDKKTQRKLLLELLHVRRRLVCLRSEMPGTAEGQQASSIVDYRIKDIDRVIKRAGIKVGVTGQKKGDKEAMEQGESDVERKIIAYEKVTKNHKASPEEREMVEKKLRSLLSETGRLMLVAHKSGDEKERDRLLSRHRRLSALLEELKRGNEDKKEPAKPQKQDDEAGVGQNPPNAEMRRVIRDVLEIPERTSIGSMSPGSPELIDDILALPADHEISNLQEARLLAGIKRMENMIMDAILRESDTEYARFMGRWLLCLPYLRSIVLKVPVNELPDERKSIMTQLPNYPLPEAEFPNAYR